MPSYFFYEFDKPPYYEEDESIEKRSPFTGLPDSASKLTSLMYLHLSSTEVTKLPDYLGNLPALERLEFDGCNIKPIPVFVRRITGEEVLKRYFSRRWR
jgi:hypothetical protein